jgi:hypothetical protein
MFLSGKWEFSCTTVCPGYIKSWKELAYFARPFMSDEEAEQKAKAKFGDLQKYKGEYVLTTSVG